MSESHTLTTHDIHALLNSPNQWDNIDRIVMITFKSLCDLLNVQSLKIDKLEKTIEYYSQVSHTSLSELSASNDTKITYNELQQFLEKKVSKSDLSYLLSNKPNFQDLKVIEQKCARIEDIGQVHADLSQIHEDLLKRWEDTISKVELEEIYRLIDTKANRIEMDEALQTKANKQAVANALHKKLNKGDFENIIAAKADVRDLQLISAAIEAKVEYTSYEHLQKEISDKFFEVEQWKESLNTIPLRNEFNSLSKELEALQQTIFDEVEKGKTISKNNLEKLKDTLTSSQEDQLTKHFSSIEEKLNLEIFSCKSQIKQKAESLELDVSKLFKTIEKLTKTFESENKFTKETLVSFQSSVKETTRESQKLISASNSMLSDIAGLQQELTRIQKNTEETLKKKVNLLQVQEMTELVKEECSLSTRQEVHQALISFKAALTEDTDRIREEIKQYLSQQDLNTSSFLEKKVNLDDFSSLVSELSSVKRGVLLLASQDELDLVRDSLEALQVACKKKADSDNTEKKKIFEGIDGIFKDLSSKASMTSMEELLETKADIGEINKSIGEMYGDIEKKLSIEEFEVQISGQSIINEALCAENRIARWIWKAGDLNAGSIIWDIQAVNTSQDIFVWDKGKSTVQVLLPGLYQIELGFFAKKKPTIGVVVNGDAVIIGGSSMSSKPWGKQVTSGVTLIDFLILPNRSRICISYAGDPAEGFFGIKKL